LDIKKEYETLEDLLKRMKMRKMRMI